MAIEIVDLPSYKMVIFHGFLYVYQRVDRIFHEISHPFLFGNSIDLIGVMGVSIWVSNP